MQDVAEPGQPLMVDKPEAERVANLSRRKIAFSSTACNVAFA
jgi:hypothetical protein